MTPLHYDWEKEKDVDQVGPTLAGKKVVNAHSWRVPRRGNGFSTEREPEKAASKTPDRVRLRLDTGEDLVVWLEGDCCSSSYFTDFSQFLELEGATIQSVEERDNKRTREKDEDGYEGSRAIWSLLVFTTDKGHVTIDWRNDSNGYYSGSVHMAILTEDDQDTIGEGASR